MLISQIFFLIFFFFLNIKILVKCFTYHTQTVKSHVTRFGPGLSSDVLLGLFPPSAENWFNEDFQEPVQDILSEGPANPFCLRFFMWRFTLCWQYLVMTLIPDPQASLLGELLFFYTTIESCEG